MTSSSLIDRIYGFEASAAIKQPCKAASTGNIAFTGTAPFGYMTIDGVSLSDNVGVVGAQPDRVLLKNQTDQTQNGVWVVSSSAWARAADFDGARDVVSGTLVYVSQGNSNGATFFSLSTTDNPVIFGTSNIVFGALPPFLSVVTPEQYGAKGDGVTDDTAAFVAAWAASSIIKLKTGATYVINTLTLGATSPAGVINYYRAYSDATAGPRPVLKHKNSATNHMLIINPTASIGFRGVEFNGNKANQGVNTWDGIHGVADAVNGYYNSFLYELDNCYVHDFSGSNIYCLNRNLNRIGMGGPTQSYAAAVNNLHLEGSTDSRIGHFEAVYSGQDSVYLKVFSFYWASGSSSHSGYNSDGTKTANPTNASPSRCGIVLDQPQGNVIIGEGVQVDWSLHNGIKILDFGPGGGSALTNRRQIQIGAFNQNNTQAGNNLFSDVVINNPSDITFLGGQIGTPYADDGVTPLGSISKYGIELSGDLTDANIGVFGTIYDTKSFNSGFTNATAAVLRETTQQNLSMPGGIIQRQGSTFTVSQLPSASSVPKGTRAFVTDATQALTAGIGATVAGSGANNVPVVSDGTNWKIG